MEYRVKSVFIYNFTRYIQWENENEAEPFIIAVLGESPIIEFLMDMALKKKVGDRKIEILLFKDISEIQASNILFIPHSQSDKVKQILEKTTSTNTLTVSETEGLANKGIIVNFKLIEENIKFELNTVAAERAELKVGSPLKKIAILVDEE
ncbi:YfiR family protein [Candidatus Latescibacterota bacterium]